MKIKIIIVAILLLGAILYGWDKFAGPERNTKGKIAQMKAWRWTAETTAVLYHECNSIDLDKAKNDQERAKMQKRGERLCTRSKDKMAALSTLCKEQIPAAIAEDESIKDDPKYQADKKQVLKICNMITQSGSSKEEGTKEGKQEQGENTKEEKENANPSDTPKPEGQVPAPQ